MTPTPSASTSGECRPRDVTVRLAVRLGGPGFAAGVSRPRATAPVAPVWSSARGRTGDGASSRSAYVRNRRAGAWRAHGAYLARDGAQRPGQRGLGFTASRDDLDLAATLGAWQAAGDARLWKAIISPEQGAELDLRLHARALVRQMEHDLGTRLEWVAIDHHNTDNPHVHLLIRGRDDHGRPLTRAWWNARSSPSSTAGCSLGPMRRAG